MAMLLFQTLGHQHQKNNKNKKSMAILSTLSHHAARSSYFITCSASLTGTRPKTYRQKLSIVRFNGISPNNLRTKLVAPSQTGGVATLTPPPSVNDQVPEEETRQNIPRKKQLVDSHRQGLIIEGGVGYRQTVVIRSYEVGPDKTITLESILNLLQETALNHVWMSGLLSNGFGATHGMMNHNLIWVVSRMQLQVDHYPIWGEVVEVDTWVGASGKNGMRRDWLIRSQATGHIFARATSTWVMMNEKTRRLSKMPEEVRGEISPWFIGKKAIQDDMQEKITKLDCNAKYVISALKPKRSDLDMNQHVNNVKYVKWMFEAIPDQVLESRQLAGIELEYRKECGSSDVVESLCEPDQGTEIGQLNGLPLASNFLENGGHLESFEMGPLRYTHLLQVNGAKANEEIVRGRTIWKRKTTL